MTRTILACDEGTSSARSVLYSLDGQVLASSQRSISSSFPEEGWVEQDAEEIWQAQLATINDLFSGSNHRIESVAALGITNQRETTLVWDRATGTPIAPAITWQCRRTQPECDAILLKNQGEWITEITGLKVDPYFSATKLDWLLSNIPGASERSSIGELAFGTIDSWLIYRLTGGKVHVMDRTNASRTMLMNLETGDWDDDMLNEFNIPDDVLPDICGSAEVVGYTSADVVGAEIPIAGIAGDQQAAMVGQQCTTVGSAKLTYGTGAFLLVHTGDQPVRSQAGLLTTAAASQSSTQEFALEGSIFSAGSAVQWLRDDLQLIQTAEETEALAESLSDTRGVHVVPAFEGLGAPFWAPRARGAIIGLTRGADKRHIARATLESIAFQVYDLIEALRQDTHKALKELRVDGGAAANNFLLQFQADILGIPVIRPKSLESTVKGAAILGGIGAGVSANWEYEVDRVFKPKMNKKDRKSKLDAWHRAVEQVVEYQAPRTSRFHPR